MIYAVGYKAKVQFSSDELGDTTDSEDIINVMADDIETAIAKARKHIEGIDWSFTDEDKETPEHVTGKLLSVSFDGIKTVFDGDFI